MELIKSIESLKTIIEKKIQDELLLLGIDGPERMARVDALFSQARMLDVALDRAFRSAGIDRLYVRLMGYDFLTGLSDDNDMNRFYNKLTNKPEFISYTADKDGRVYMIE